MNKWLVFHNGELHSKFDKETEFWVAYGSFPKNAYILWPNGNWYQETHISISVDYRRSEEEVPAIYRAMALVHI